MPAETEVQEISTTGEDQLAELSAEQYKSWRETGKLPEAARTEEAPASPAPQTGEKVADEKSAAPGSEPGKREEKESGRSKTERRFRELLQQRGEYRARAEAAEKELEELRRARPAERPAPAAEPGTRMEAPPSTLAEKIKAINANDAQYSTYEEKVAAIAKATAEELLAEREKEKSKADAKQKLDDELKTAVDRVNKSAEISRKLHADFDKVVDGLSLSSVIPAGSPVEKFILDSAQAGELAYHLGSNREELASILKMPEVEQWRRLASIEAKFIPPPDDQNKKEPPKPPPPPRELGAGGGSARDAVEEAIRNGDFAAYKRTQNQRELERASRRG